MSRMGFFEELPHGDTDGGSLVVLAGQGDGISRDWIADYLDEGAVVAASTTVLVDVLAEDRSPICSLAVLTDGVWLWPSDLAHYVREYDVRLPAPFVRHAEDSGRVPARPSEEALDGIEKDFLG
ncbi:hypothetical protein HNR06_001628 [Nocardiopsis arvandica]|uniref:Uncharacterized protein n=1 Tax=Nocardiopsis sinuspersici TaxID=501010 RepID=A0A7Z0BK45_9ACTN|nr:hypothetical protein [Nocardiopsis sinuspersici]NYH52039.1 hypothetical protein [Nocardiopsis sinuspersici]